MSELRRVDRLKDAARLDRVQAVRNRILAAADGALVEGEISAMELLAVMSHVVGQIVAVQDAASLTPVEAMEIVNRNIVEGNKSVAGRFVAGTGSRN